LHIERARLVELGWDESFDTSLARLCDPTLEPGRIAADHGVDVLVHTARGRARAGLAAALRDGGRPVAVGDWVAIRPAAGPPEVAAILDRRTAIARKVPDAEVREQVLAANVDIVFIATALDGDFNVRRVERLLTVAYQSGATPAVLLTKSDVGPVDASLAAVEGIAPSVPVVPVSPLTGAGVDAVRKLLAPGRTAVLVGSSGVGKSTLINRLLGIDVLRTGDVHRTGQGRHTTTRRELLLVPSGGVVIDTPGLREIQLWTGEEALDRLFADVEDLTLRCRFSNCRHGGEPGCAVAAALADGRLDPDRWTGFRKLQRELRAVEARSNARLRAEDQRRWKAIRRAARGDVAAKHGGG